jgi:hypothetical protein
LFLVYCLFVLQSAAGWDWVAPVPDRNTGPWDNVLLAAAFAQGLNSSADGVEPENPSAGHGVTGKAPGTHGSGSDDGDDGGGSERAFVRVSNGPGHVTGQPADLSVPRGLSRRALRGGGEGYGQHTGYEEATRGAEGGSGSSEGEDGGSAEPR